MNSTLRKDADAIIASSLNAVLPDEAVRRVCHLPCGGGSAGPCGRRRGRDQIQARQGRNSGSKLL